MTNGRWTITGAVESLSVCAPNAKGSALQFIGPESCRGSPTGSDLRQGGNRPAETRDELIFVESRFE